KKAVERLALRYGDDVVEMVGRAAARAGKELTEAEARQMAKFAARLAESGLSEARIERILVAGNDPEIANMINDIIPGLSAESVNKLKTITRLFDEVLANV
ncbi:MAG: hypothetical protein QW227_01670, partial [Candidatus Aenigmatarchaeota archaeon]